MSFLGSFEVQITDLPIIIVTKRTISMIWVCTRFPYFVVCISYFQNLYFDTSDVAFQTFTYVGFTSENANYFGKMFLILCNVLCLNV